VHEEPNNDFFILASKTQPYVCWQAGFMARVYPGRLTMIAERRIQQPEPAKLLECALSLLALLLRRIHPCQTPFAGTIITSWTHDAPLSSRRSCQASTLTI